MKIKLGWKDPDGPEEYIHDFVAKNTPRLQEITDRAEWRRAYEEEMEELKEKLYRILGSLEYLTIEVDLEAETVKVLKR